MDRERARLLEELAANAIAPTTVQVVDGWVLRAAPELPFRRASSVQTGHGEPGDLDARLGVVEAFYAARGLPARVQVDPASRPDGVDAALAARDYAIEAPVEVHVADAHEVLERSRPRSPSPRVEVGARLAEGWIAEHAAGLASDDPTVLRTAAYARMLPTVGPTTVAVAARLDGPVVALGLGVVERGWLGVFGMTTRREARRRGLASAVLAALAAAGLEHGARALYLQVEAANEMARSLYTGVGFARHHGHHYRTRYAAVAPAAQ